jgi:group I intron endonuclease
MSEIYIITNKINGKQYVGQTKSYLSTGQKYGTLARFKAHCSKGDHSSRLQEAIREIGKENFMVETLLLCDHEQADNMERRFINIYGTLQPHGYNMETGGNVRKTIHEHSKELMSQKKRFVRMKEETKEEILKIMDELKISEIPRGVRHCGRPDSKRSAFSVVVGKQRKVFCARDKTLKEKFIQAMTYYNLLKTGDEEGMKQFKGQLSKEMSIRRSKIRGREIYDVPEVKEAMNALGITILPIGITFDKRKNKFYYRRHSMNKIFEKTFNKGILVSLKEAIEYVNSETDVGLRAELPAQ